MSKWKTKLNTEGNNLNSLPLQSCRILCYKIWIYIHVTWKKEYGWTRNDPKKDNKNHQNYSVAFMEGVVWSIFSLENKRLKEGKKMACKELVGHKNLKIILNFLHNMSWKSTNKMGQCNFNRTWSFLFFSLSLGIVSKEDIDTDIKG